MRKIENFLRYFMYKMKVTESEFASAYLAFFLLLSFVPLLVFISNLVVNIFPNFNEFIYGLMESLPNDVQNIFEPILDNIFNGVSSSLSIISIFSALWLGSRGFLGLMNALNKIFQVESKSKIPFYDKIFSVVFTVVFLIVIIGVLLFTVFNERILALVTNITDDIEVINTLADILVSWLGYLMPIILQVLLLAFFYRYAPAFDKTTKPTTKGLFLGSLFGALGISGMTFFYKFTNDTLQRSPSIYGSLGSVLVTLIWLLAICNMLIYGAIFIKTYDDVVVGKTHMTDIDVDTKFIFKR